MITSVQSLRTISLGYFTGFALLIDCEDSCLQHL